MPNPGLPPTLLTPGNNSTGPQLGEQFTWQFNTANADTQGKFAFRGGPFGVQYTEEVSGVPAAGFNIESVGFSPDGTRLAVGQVTASGSPRLRVLNLSTMAYVTGITVATGAVNAVAWSPNNLLLATAHQSNGFAVYNTSTWTTITGIPSLGSVSGRSLAFSPDGTKLAVGYSVAPFFTVYNTSDWSVVSGTPVMPFQARSLAFSPNGSFLALALDGSPGLTVLNTSDWSVVPNTMTTTAPRFGVTWAPDGTRLVLGGGTASSTQIQVVNTSTWSLVLGFSGLGGAVNSVQYSPDGTLVAASVEGTVAGAKGFKLLKTSNWTTDPRSLDLGGSGRSVSFSPDGSRLAVGRNAADHLRIIERTPGQRWWNGTAWQDTEVFITSSSQSLTLPPNSWM
jgi:WD40 repeat protein